jgi:hypothetical protein
MTPYATSQTSDHNRRFYVQATSSTYDEVALTKGKRKCQRKLIQYQEETTHPQPRTETTKIFSTRIITSATKHTALQQARLKRYTSR